MTGGTCRQIGGIQTNASHLPKPGYRTNYSGADAGELLA